MQTIASAVISIYDDQVKEEEGQLSFVTHGHNFNYVCEEDLIHIILSNLIDNAIKYSGNKPQITITLQATESIFSLEVADKGVGIPKEHQSRIFEQYYRVPKGDIYETKGFGIGLFHVKQIADQLQGDVKVYSSHNNGSRFVVEWPRRLENE